MQLFIVRFVRNDGKPHEEYYYPDLSAAEEHLNLFLDDDSELYSKIELVQQEPEKDIVLKEISYQ